MSGFESGTRAVSVRKAIELGLFSHGTWYFKSQARDQSALRLRIREIAQSRPRFGYLRIHVMLRREGWLVVTPSFIRTIWK